MYLQTHRNDMAGSRKIWSNAVNTLLSGMGKNDRYPSAVSSAAFRSLTHTDLFFCFDRLHI